MEKVGDIGIDMLEAADLAFSVYPLVRADRKAEDRPTPLPTDGSEHPSVDAISVISSDRTLIARRVSELSSAPGLSVWRLLKSTDPDRVPQAIQDAADSIRADLGGVTAALENVEFQLEFLTEVLDGGLRRIESLTGEQLATLRRIEELLSRPLDTQARERRDRGVLAYSRGLYEEAASDLERAVEDNTYDHIAWLCRGHIHLRGGEDVSALRCYDMAMRYANADQTVLIEAFASLGRSRALQNLQRPSEALEAITRAMELAGNRSDCRYERARAQLELGDKQGGLFGLVELLTEQPLFFSALMFNDIAAEAAAEATAAALQEADARLWLLYSEFGELWCERVGVLAQASCTDVWGAVARNEACLEAAGAEADRLDRREFERRMATYREDLRKWEEGRDKVRGYMVEYARQVAKANSRREAALWSIAAVLGVLLLSLAVAVQAVTTEDVRGHDTLFFVVVLLVSFAGLTCLGRALLLLVPERWLSSAPAYSPPIEIALPDPPMPSPPRRGALRVRFSEDPFFGALGSPRPLGPTRSDKRRFDVVLIGPGERLVDVVAAVRAVSHLGLKEAKDLIDRAPIVVLAAAERWVAEAAGKKIVAAGGTIDLVASG